MTAPSVFGMGCGGGCCTFLQAAQGDVPQHHGCLIVHLLGELLVLTEQTGMPPGGWIPVGIEAALRMLHVPHVKRSSGGSAENNHLFPRKRVCDPGRLDADPVEVLVGEFDGVGAVHGHRGRRDAHLHIFEGGGLRTGNVVAIGGPYPTTELAGGGVEFTGEVGGVIVGEDHVAEFDELVHHDAAVNVGEDRHGYTAAAACLPYQEEGRRRVLAVGVEVHHVPKNLVQISVEDVLFR
mmetsp:Transcript_7349/g.9176  ORF Transcript_7349/g.9176 Transcript_7349/m.9176 type:complete len:237 (-) Transcript_7349:1885-2595(-)